MALFFDSAWFDSRLAATHLSRPDLARALGVTDSEIAEIWKDQRELSERDVTIMAALLGTNAEEIATRAGISTPVPQTGDAPKLAQAMADLAQRLDRIERTLAEMKALLDGPRAR